MVCKWGKSSLTDSTGQVKSISTRTVYCGFVCQAACHVLTFFLFKGVPSLVLVPLCSVSLRWSSCLWQSWGRYVKPVPEHKSSALITQLLSLCERLLHSFFLLPLFSHVILTSLPLHFSFSSSCPCLNGLLFLQLPPCCENTTPYQSFPLLQKHKGSRGVGMKYSHIHSRLTPHMEQKPHICSH